MHRTWAEDRLASWRYPLFALVACLLALSSDVGSVASSSSLLFHEGEYVGQLWKIRGYFAGEAGFPVLIHGAMDYAPSVVAAGLYGETHVIGGTRIVNTAITVLAWVVFLDLCWKVTRGSGQRPWLPVLAVAAFVLLAPRPGAAPWALQTAFVGVRDLFLLLTVWCCAGLVHAREAWRRPVLAALGGVSAVIALFWSYDRGIMALAFLGCISAGFALRHSWRDVAALLGAAAVTALLLQVTGIFGGVAENAANVIYWIRRSAETFGRSYPDPDLVSIQVSIVLFTAASAVAVFGMRRGQQRDSLVLLLGLVVVQLLLLKSVMNRPGMPRLTWAIWPSLLIFFQLASSARPMLETAVASLRQRRLPLAELYALACCLLFAWAVHSTSPAYRWAKPDYSAFASQLRHPSPDVALVPAEVAQVASELAASGDSCVLGWVNEGVFGLLAGKPFCTDYAYAVYVARDRESQYLQQLVSAGPSSIVFRVSGDSMVHIDGRRMAERLPEVDRYIRDHYPRQRRVGRYTIVSR
jgi:hypothetical protein